MDKVICDSQINGSFNGWNGDTVYALTNGQVWQQVHYRYHYHYAYRPYVKVFETSNGYEMLVENDDGVLVQVKRIS